MEIQQHEPTTYLAIAEQARAKYELATNLAITAKDAARDAVLAMADMGAMVELGWEMCRGGKTGDDAGAPATRAGMLESWGIPLDDADKATYLHRNREQLELALWPQDVAKIAGRFVGLLPPPGSAHRSTDDPERTGGAPSHWLSYAGKLHKSVSALFDSKPVEQWRLDERENVKKSLRPIVELWERL